MMLRDGGRDEGSAHGSAEGSAEGSARFPRFLVFIGISNHLRECCDYFAKSIKISPTKTTPLAIKYANYFLRQAKRQADSLTWECFVPNLGTFRSHRGNIAFH